jgi:phosphate starvation-inducible PhoH-like protein
MTTKRRRKKAKTEVNNSDSQQISIKIEVKPRTENQVKYLKALIENEIVFCSGPAGVGKSMLAVYFACTCLVQGLIDKIIVTRPMVTCGRGLGWLSGNLEDKFNPYASPVIEAMTDMLGQDVFNRLIKEKVIEIIPLELCRGKNFHRSVVLADEMQNATLQQLTMILTRHGQYTKTIITGDPRQSDLYVNDFVIVMEKLEDLDGVGIVRLDRSDIQRSGIIANILERLEDTGPVKPEWNNYEKN